MLEVITHNKFKTELSNVSLYYLAPNPTSVIQPCDQVIIRNFKVKYRCLLCKFCVKMIDEIDELVMSDIKQTKFFIKEAWTKVSQENISNCWNKPVLS